jgi:hypothetical protein
MDTVTTALKAFVVAGGILLLAGTALLVIMLYQRAGADRAPPPAPTEVTPIALPAGARIEQVIPDGRRGVILLAVDPDGRQYLAVVDPLTGERLSLVPVEPAAAAP